MSAEIDVTQLRLRDVELTLGLHGAGYRRAAAARRGKQNSKVEERLLARFLAAGETSLGFVSNPLVYSDVARRMPVLDRFALVSLLARGRLMVVRRWVGDLGEQEFVVPPRPVHRF